MRALTEDRAVGLKRCKCGAYAEAYYNTCPNCGKEYADYTEACPTCPNMKRPDDEACALCLMVWQASPRPRNLLEGA